MAPFGSGGETLPSEMPAQLAPTLGAPGIPGPLGVVPGLRLDGAVPFALNWARPFTPVRPDGRAPWPDAAPAEAMEPITAAAKVATPRVNNRRFLTEPPSHSGNAPRTSTWALWPSPLDCGRASSHIRVGNHNSPSWIVTQTTGNVRTRSASRRGAATGRPR